MLVVLALCWFVGAVAVPVWRVRAMVVWSHETYERIYNTGCTMNAADEKELRGHVVNQLGGPVRAGRLLGQYTRLPDCVAPHKHVAMELLADCGASGVDALCAGLRSREPLCRLWAVRALVCLGPDAEAAVPALIKVLEDPDPSIRSYAAEALGGIGPPAIDAVPALIKVVQGREKSEIHIAHNYPGYELYQARSLSVQALGSIDPDAAVILPTLERALGDRDYLVRWAAARTAGRLGPRARKLTPAIGKLRDNSHAWVQVTAIRAHARITGGADSKAIACLRQGLRQGAGGGWLDAVRENGLEAQMVPELIEALSRNGDSEERSKIIGMLGSVGPRARQAIPELEKALASNDALASPAAKAALAKIRAVAP